MCSRPYDGIERPRILFRIVDALPGVLDVEDLVPERTQPEQIHQRAPGHAAERIATDDAGEEDPHDSSCASSSIVNGSSSDLPTTRRCHIRR